MKCEYFYSEKHSVVKAGAEKVWDEAQKTFCNTLGCLEGMIPVQNTDVCNSEAHKECWRYKEAKKS